MHISLSRLIRAPTDAVFDFFDDPRNTLQANVHAANIEIVDTRPDGRRTFDIAMRAGAREWMQTVEQVVREPPTRLVTSGGTWTTDRGQWLLAVTTDRRFTTEETGTRVDVSIEAHLDRPMRRPIQAIQNWAWRGATRSEFDLQLDYLAHRIEVASETDEPR